FALTLLDAAGGRFRVPLADAVALVRAVRLPGRFQRVGRWIFDVAHNVDGARTVAASIEAVVRDAPVVAVLCVLGDKDWRAMLDALAPVVSRFLLTNAPTVPASRSWPLEEVLAYATSRGYPASAVPDFSEAIRQGSDAGSTTLVTGSFHTVGDAMARLQVSPLAG
ncbi:MAG: hypothetical protein LH467_10880, partial [Gemmatimonadaceae bacterium]|nr:hypothetical protein [Gemmatimonadaceae bacterium]